MMRISGGLRRFRWLVFVGWLLALVPAAYLAVAQSSHLTGGGFEVAGSQSQYVHDQVLEHYPGRNASSLALVAAPRADAGYQDMDAAVALLHAVVDEVDGVTAVSNPAQPPPRPDRSYVVSLDLDYNRTGAVDVAKELRARLGVNGDKPGSVSNGTVRLYVIGQGALGAAAGAKTKQDIAAAEKWNLPIVLIVLLAVFGSLAAAAVPLALGVVTVVVSMGLVHLLSLLTPMSVFVTSTVSMFGVALAIDYSLFILMRYREELRVGRRPDQAVDAAMATSGLAVVMSGLTVIASITGIYLINTPVLISIATGAILAVAIAVLTAVTATPAVLATFGRSVAKRSSLLRFPHRPESTESRFWTGWIMAVMRRPWLSALLASAFLLALAAPATSMTLGNSMLRQFDSAHEARSGAAAAGQAVGSGALGPIQILVTFGGGAASDPAHETVLSALHAEIAHAPHTIKQVPAPVFADDHSSALFSAVLSVDPEDMTARETVSWLRARLSNIAAHSGARVDVGGPTALIKDFDDRVSATEPTVLVFVALIAFLMLLVSIRSLFLAFKGVVMTVLSVLAAYGSLVMVFQWGWLAPLGLASTGSIDSFIPPIVLAMTFGLSMDYEIFLLGRVRERFLQTGDTRDAVTYGVNTSARTITSAALIMIAVFVGFAFVGMPLVAELGVACAVAIAVDATVVRLVLVPALMAMFHRWNWWLPRWLGWLLPPVDFEKPLPAIKPGDVVVLPDPVAAAAPGTDLRAVRRSAARLRQLAPEMVHVTDRLVLHDITDITAPAVTVPALVGAAGTPGATSRRRIAGTRIQPRRNHPVTVWRNRVSAALDALEGFPAGGPEVAGTPGGGAVAFRRGLPLETVTVQLPTGEWLHIPTVIETVRLRGCAVVGRNTRRDYTDLLGLTETLGRHRAAAVLSTVDRYYCDQSTDRRPIATQLVRHLADPDPVDEFDAALSDQGGRADWDDVRRRCLSLAVAILEAET